MCNWGITKVKNRFSHGSQYEGLKRTCPKYEAGDINNELQCLSEGS
jgi:hypothetical protein